ncbi:transglutaminase-like domain-containing protein [Microbacterium trichothecenolyticum]|uniref:Transglutaminase-like putative cysteine protease n=1 Tax=Microbacterium trichothecenolyticum TaxID=69370 RepID=A0ABU0TWE2_MICTR|nr:transglutaminase family protein [Microbacterium trichothecenolyticum]MDQ1123259.1 transglutaminase-like putative cysteine protease [Microbacterium trichothecenolyticum]
MNARVTAEIELQVDTEADVVLSIAAASGWPTRERLVVTGSAGDVAATEHEDHHGGRLHRAHLPVGSVRIFYEAETAAPTAPAPTDDLDSVRYLRPSRYVPFDALTTIPDIDATSDREVVARVPKWVFENLSYVSGSSGPADTAADTLTRGEGVCRDYAHVTIALLRAAGVPARLVSVYAPGLEPMDFHAVVEAFVDGRWEVVDATRLAPRTHYVRIATGRDAADTAFLTTLSGAVSLSSVEVSAVATEPFVTDDHTGTVLLK